MKWLQSRSVGPGVSCESLLVLLARSLLVWFFGAETVVLCCRTIGPDPLSGCGPAETFDTWTRFFGDGLTPVSGILIRLEGVRL